LDQAFAFVQALGEGFLPTYLPLVARKKDMPVEPMHFDWQRMRRGRYVEFNLVHDRGTRFGLVSNGRTESILMSMPPQANWAYNYEVIAGSNEAQTQGQLKKGKDWLGGA
ncbi:MAG TPA: coproporphyrinogen III oxidase, partial [Flavobacteriales bacterium]|nr:coproporphyrinogen III oxidase [Flavobacteriales bacterium]